MNQASARCIFRRNGMPRSREGIRGVTGDAMDTEEEDPEEDPVEDSDEED